MSRGSSRWTCRVDGHDGRRNLIKDVLSCQYHRQVDLPITMGIPSCLSQEIVPSVCREWKRYLPQSVFSGVVGVVFEDDTLLTSRVLLTFCQPLKHTQKPTCSCTNEQPSLSNQLGKTTIHIKYRPVRPTLKQHTAQHNIIQTQTLRSSPTPRPYPPSRRASPHFSADSTTPSGLASFIDQATLAEGTKPYKGPVSSPAKALITPRQLAVVSSK